MPVLSRTDVQGMNQRELRQVCRAYGVSPAGSRDVLLERMLEALDAIALVMAEAEEAEDATESTQPHDGYDDAYDMQPAGIPSIRPHEYHEVPPPTIGDEEYEEHLPVIKHVPALRSDGVSHLFNAEAAGQMVPPVPRCAAAPAHLPGGVPYNVGESDEGRKPPPTPLDKNGATNSSHLTYLFHPELVETEEPPPPPTVRYDYSNSDHVADVLHVEGYDEFSDGLQPEAPPSRPVTAPIPQLDGEAVAMIKELKVPDLRVMLRKRGINPSGSREVLQQRLSTFLLGTQLDVGFEPIASGISWGTSSLENNVRSDPPPATPQKQSKGGGPSTLGYLLGGQ